jgi:hypothetical protein
VAPLAISVGSASAARRGDTIAAVFGLSDSIFFFDAYGEARGRLPIPSEELARSTSSLGAVAGSAVPGQGLESIISVSDLFWLPDGSILVQMASMGAEARFRLLGIDANGRKRFELADTPRLLAVRDDRLFFHHPESVTPDRWAVARLR